MINTLTPTLYGGFDILLSGPTYDTLTIPNKVIHISIPGVGIKKVIHIPPSGMGVYPSPPRYPPSPPVRMSQKGGQSPLLIKKNFWEKMTPLLKLVPLYMKKNFWENFGIYGI